MCVCAIALSNVYAFDRPRWRRQRRRKKARGDNESNRIFNLLWRKLQIWSNLLLFLLLPLSAVKWADVMMLFLFVVTQIANAYAKAKQTHASNSIYELFTNTDWFLTCCYWRNPKPVCIVLNIAPLHFHMTLFEENIGTGIKTKSKFQTP